MNARPEIDEIDVKILKILQINPRARYRKIAKILDSSINVVSSRYHRLCQCGIVVTEIMGFQPKLQGFDYYAWLGIITCIGKEEFVLKTLDEQPSIIQNYVEIGEYNIRSLAMLKSMDDMPDLLDAIKKNDFVVSIDVMFWTKIEKMAYPTNLVIKTYPGTLECDLTAKNIKQLKILQTTKPLKTSTKLNSKSPKLDSIDRHIINVLSIKARTPFRQISQMENVCTKTIISHFNKLKKHIWYATLSLDLEKLGYPGHLSCLIKISKLNSVSAVYERLTKIPNVIAATQLIGPYDIDILIPFSDINDLANIKNTISQIQGIQKVSYQIGESVIWPPPRNKISDNMPNPKTTSYDS